MPIDGELAKAIRSGDLKLAIYGLGLVGSTIAAVWLRFGGSVIGVDVNKGILEKARRGGGPPGEPLVSEAFRRGLEEARLQLTDDGRMASEETRIKFMAVPVTWSGGSLDLEPLKAALRSSLDGMRSGDAVIVKPTLPIGTSRNVILPLLSAGGLRAEEDYLYIYSPERISAGRAVLDVEEHYPAIVSGVGPRSLGLARSLYGLIAKAGVISMSSIEAAEAEKVFEGVYRDVNIALSNELAMVADRLDLNYDEIRAAANSQPYSHLHVPGPGVGGACIPVYPWFLIKNALEVGVAPDLVLMARRINRDMPLFFADLVDSEVGGVAGKAIAVLGLSFRGDIADSRLSPTYDLAAELLKRGARVRVHDPFIEHDRTLEAMSIVLTKDLGEAMRGVSAVIVVTDHSAYKDLDGQAVAELSGGNPLVLDTRRILRPERFAGMKLKRFAGFTASA